MRRTALALIGLAIAGCSGAATKAAPAHVTVQETLGPHEVALPSAPHTAGHFNVQTLLGRCGITYLTGTHAEFEPQNPLCRVHERVTSRDASYHSFSTARQRLILADGTQVAPSIDAMQIKRQPDVVTVGGRDVIELDVYFEPPPGSPPKTLRFYGDSDTGKSVTPPGPLSVDLPVTALAAAR
ncbi:MAG: hypothetical protein JO079_10710 [Frankiaceae bacterium]|nr:hypothetical protein [Frankiaceae bacterium]MBV9369192.1 hypothetical protein [Frankiales bacterium]